MEEASDFHHWHQEGHLAVLITNVGNRGRQPEITTPGTEHTLGLGTRQGPSRGRTHVRGLGAKQIFFLTKAFKNVSF